MAADSWCYEAVRSAYESGIASGTTAVTFTPDGTLTRGQAAVLLWRLAGSPAVNYAMDFPDVAEDAYCAEAVRWAAALGIVRGYGDGTFGIGIPVTREQFAAMLYRYAQSGGQGFVGAWAFPLDYPDAGQVSGFAYEPLCWLTMNGVISGGSGGLLAPGDPVTRAQAAVMLQRYQAL